MEPLLPQTNSFTYRPDVPSESDMVASKNYKFNNIRLCDFLVNMDREEDEFLKNEELEVQKIHKICQYSPSSKAAISAWTIGGTVLGAVVCGGLAYFGTYYLPNGSEDNVVIIISSVTGGLFGGGGGFCGSTLHISKNHAEFMKNKRIARLEAKVHSIDQELVKVGIGQPAIDQLNTAKQFFADKIVTWKNYKPEPIRDPGPIYSA